MPSILDSRVKIKAIDKSGLIASVEALSDQITDTLAQTNNLIVPESYKNVKNIVVSGMGGSALGAHLIKQLYKNELTIPFDVVSSYKLPSYVNQDTLVILSSYSGTTEETLESAEEAKAKGAKILVITSGGKLADLAQANSWPMYLMQVNYNPCNQPRLAIGYAVVGMIMLLTKVGILPNQASDFSMIADNLKKIIVDLTVENENSPAKTLAFSAYDKHIVFVAAEHLIGAAHIFNNQVNENAKTLTSEWHLPEFNHHYMEALSYPKLAKDSTVFFLFNSPLYHPRIQKRVLITKDLLEQKGYEVHVILATTASKLEQVFEIIQIGEFVAAYLPILYGIDPSSIPNVDFFKTEMAK